MRPGGGGRGGGGSHNGGDLASQAGVSGGVDGVPGMVRWNLAVQRVVFPVWLFPEPLFRVFVQY